MINNFDDNLIEYIEAHSSAESAELRQIKRLTNVLTVNPHMLSGHIQGRILSMISKMICPKHILELGTFTAYSTLCLAEGLQPDGTIDTVEHNDELEELIVRNISQSSYKNKIFLHIADATEWLKSCKQTYDLIFIDADKRQYIDYYQLALPLLRNGGFMLVDNTLWDGHIIDSAYDKDKQTIALRQFNDFVANDRQVEKVILPIRDGITIIRKL